MVDWEGIGGALNVNPEWLRFGTNPEIKTGRSADSGDAPAGLGSLDDIARLVESSASAKEIEDEVLSKLGLRVTISTDERSLPTNRQAPPCRGEVGDGQRFKAGMSAVEVSLLFLIAAVLAFAALFVFGSHMQ
jgi:hypothetical protein